MATEPTTSTLCGIARLHAAERPDATAFVFEGRSTTYAAFDRYTDQVAQALLAAGLGPGNRIAVVAKNSDIFFELLIGATKVGVVTIPVNWRLAPPEVAAILADAGAKLVVAGPEFTFMMSSIAALLPATTLYLAAEPAVAPWPSYEAWRDAQPARAPAHEVLEDDVALQLYTSGTTGLPKGVMLTHANFTRSYAADAATDLGWNRWRPGESSLLAMPISHIAGTGWGLIALSRGAACHVLRQFDPDEMFDAIDRHRVGKVFLVPAALRVLVRHPRAKSTDFGCVAQMAYGASPMPVALLRECIDVLKCGFVQVYGMTETTGSIVAMPPEDHLDPASPRLRAAGKPLPWIELRVVDSTGADVPVGTVGEIVTRSSATMAGYWNRPEETARTIRDGWLHSGDAGFLDADGYLFIHDRVKDMIISGGENVYPAEVESALSEHPAVADVAVFGVPDERWGEAVRAAIVLQPDAELTEAALIAWSRERVAGFKAPQAVDFTDALPRNAAGKLLKRELRDRYWAGMNRQVN